MSKWVRSGVLAGAEELVRALGGDPPDLLERSGVGARALLNPEMPIPVAAVVRFLDMAASELGCDAFGLRLGAAQDLALFGRLQPLLESAGTVGELIRDLAAFFPLHTEGAIVVAEPAPTRGPESAPLIKADRPPVGGERVDDHGGDGGVGESEGESRAHHRRAEPAAAIPRCADPHVEGAKSRSAIAPITGFLERRVAIPGYITGK